MVLLWKEVAGTHLKEPGGIAPLAEGEHDGATWMVEVAHVIPLAVDPQRSSKRARRCHDATQGERSRRREIDGEKEK